MSVNNSKDRAVVAYKYNLDIESVTHKRIGRYKVVKTREMSHLSYSVHTNVVYMESEQKLCYSGQKCYRIPDVLAKIYGHSVHSLDLSYNELTSLRGLEMFPLLRELILDNNQLTDTIVFPYMPHLHTLSLNKNRLTDIEELVIKIHHNMPKLTYLSLLGNKACPNQLSDIENDEEDYERYRLYVLHYIQHLRFLDSRAVTQSELIEAKRRGQFMKVVRPKVTEQTRSSASTPPPTFPFTPLPKNLRDPSDHRESYDDSDDEDDDAYTFPTSFMYDSN